MVTSMMTAGSATRFTRAPTVGPSVLTLEPYGSGSSGVIVATSYVALLRRRYGGQYLPL
jgi:hypothetical protein